MKRDLLYTLKNLNYLSQSDLEHIGKSVKRERLERLLNTLIVKGEVLLLKSKENKLGEEILVLGPNADKEEGEYLIKGNRKSLDEIYWNKVMGRCKRNIRKEIDELKIDLLKQYDSIENLEKRYFDISIKYHAFYNYFFNLNLNEEIKGKILVDEFEDLFNNIKEIKLIIEKAKS